LTGSPGFFRVSFDYHNPVAHHNRISYMAGFLFLPEINLLYPATPEVVELFTKLAGADPLPPR
jgi:hypothetical protein